MQRQRLLNGPSLGRQFLRQRSHLLQNLVGALGLFSIDTADCKPYMHHDVIADFGFRHEIESNGADDPAKLDSSHPPAAALLSVENLSRNREAHRSSRPFIESRKCTV